MVRKVLRRVAPVATPNPGFSFKPIPVPRTEPISFGWREAVICSALFGAIVLLYSQVAWHQFIICDDREYIYENAQVKQGLTWQGVKWAFESPHAGNWHPLTWISHMLDVSIFGVDRPGGHHLVNVFLHGMSAVILFLAIRLMTGTRWAAAMVAALFALHPLRVESVAWTAERKDCLSGLFWMLTLLSYAWYARKPHIGKYLAVTLCIALGLLSKAMLVTLPCILFLLDVWPLGRQPLWYSNRSEDPNGKPYEPSRLWPIWWLSFEKIPWFALAGFASYKAVGGQDAGVALSDLVGFPMKVRVANAATAYVTYLGQTLWPTGMSIFYPHPNVLVESPRLLPASFYIDAYRAGALLALITIAAVVLLVLRRPYVLIGWLWYIGALVPAIGLVQVGTQGRADRYTYLPMIGIYLAVVWGAKDLMARWPRLRPVYLGLAPAVLFACSVITWMQVAHWENNYTLFEWSAKATPDNYFAYNHLGMAYDKQREKALAAGETEKADKAIEMAAVNYKKALEIKPNYDFGNNNLGVYYAYKKDYATAAKYFLHALEINSRYADANANLGVVETGLKQYAEAEKYCLAAIRIKGADVRASDLRNLGLALEGEEKFAEAEHAYDTALQVDPSNISTMLPYANLLTKLNKVEKAKEIYLRAASLDPSNADIQNAAGVYFAAHGEPGKAAELLEKTRNLLVQSADAHPDIAGAQFNAGVFFAQHNDLTNAARFFEKTLSIDPNHGPARHNLDVIRQSPGGAAP